VVVTGGYQGINIQLVPAATPQDLWIEGVTFVGMEGGYAVFSVGSGDYRFTTAGERQ
jgi:hypothetical protein